LGALKIFTSSKQIMKHSFSLKLATIVLLAVVGVTGCRTKSPKDITPIYGSTTKVGGDQGAKDLTAIQPVNPPRIGGGERITGQPPINPEIITGPPAFPPVTDRTGNTGSSTGPDIIIDGHLADRAIFAANSVHFDYDKAVLKASELGKLQPVIAALKAAPQNKLRVEGHCDERGTEEYNRALGERRALAIRDFIIKSGKIAPNRVTTTSLGEDKPAELGHSEAAWAKNRRGELVLLKPQN
jgi:peptidoglycan-associated lipoprotein